MTSLIQARLLLVKVAWPGSDLSCARMTQIRENISDSFGLAKSNKDQLRALDLLPAGSRSSARGARLIQK